MTYDVFGSTYTFLTPEWLWLLVCLPLLWLPVFWQRQRLVITSAALLHSLAAVLIVGALAGLNDEKAKGARVILERQVDRGLLSAHDLLDSRLRRFIGPVLGTESGIDHIEDYAVALAKYRKANPSPFQGQYLSHDPEETPERRASIAEASKRRHESTRIINLMIERYASK